MGCSGTRRPLQVITWREPGHAGHLHLQPLDRGIHVANGAAGSRFFAHHVPRLERLTHLEVHAAARHRAAQREAKLQMRREPLGLQPIPAAPQVGQDIVEVLRDEMRQHEAIVQFCAPADECLIVRRFPEPRDQRPQQELLRQAHAPVRRHLERPQLDEALPAAAAVRIVELVDAELGSMRVACDVNQQVAEDAIDQPWRSAVPFAESRKRDLQLVNRIVARLVHAWMLTRRAEEQPGEQVRHRRMVVPVAHQTAEQVGPPEDGAVGCASDRR